MRRKGLSNVISGSIVLVGLLTVLGALFLSIHTISQGSMEAWRQALENEKARMETSLELNVAEIGDRSVTVLVKNRGSTTVFLKPGWNDLIIYYEGGGRWTSYMVSFNATVRVAGSQAFFPSTHNFINPGEEAVLVAQVPDGAPDIVSGSTVVVVFVSHYGVSASGEAVKP